MANSTSTRKQLNDLVECPICTEVYKDPRTLPCLHTFCLKCCERFSRNKTPGSLVACPLCREKFAVPSSGIHGLRKNFVLEKLMLINQSPSSGDVDLNLEEVKSSVGPSRFCDKHTSKTIEVYCVECKEALCTSCLTKNHSSHKVSDIDDVTEELRLTLTSGVTDLKAAYGSCELLLNKIENEAGKFMKHIKTLETEIIGDAKRLQEIIERHKLELLAQVAVKTSERLKELDHSKAEVRQQMASLSSLMTYTTELVRTGTAGDLAREAKSLNMRSQQLLDSDNNSNTESNSIGCYSLAYTPCSETNSTEIDNFVGTIAPVTIKKVCSLPEDNFISGLTTLDKHLYVHYYGQDIAVYDTETYSIQRRLSVPGLVGVNDVVSCKHFACIYIGDYVKRVIHRVVEKTTGSGHEYTSWAVDDIPGGLSVNSDHYVIVTCHRANKIKLFTTYGEPVKVIILHESEIRLPWHTIQLADDKFVVCHGGTLDDVTDPLHRVCIIDGTGRVKQSFDGATDGLGKNPLNSPLRLAVSTRVIYVVDMNNRVVMLSSNLRYIRTVVAVRSGTPTRIWFDQHGKRLYFDESKWENNQWTTGHVDIYSITT